MTRAVPVPANRAPAYHVIEAPWQPGFPATVRSSRRCSAELPPAIPIFRQRRLSALARGYLESGCSIDQAAGEICVQPLVNAGIEYYKACAGEWIKLFRRPRNRIAAWKN